MVCRKSIGDKKFEIMCDPKLALEFKRGGAVDMRDVLAYPVIYKDASSVEAVPEEDLQKAFGTTDAHKIAERIIKEGDLQLTTEQRREMLEQKKTQLAELISRRAINPQTNTPHPPQRVRSAMDQSGVAIDGFTDAELQFDKVLKAIKPIIPISVQKVIIQLKVPPQFAGRVYSVIKGVGTIRQEQWLNDGSLQIQVEVLGGMQVELMDRLGKLTHGNYESKVLKREDTE